jgi:hypothetical protein
MWISRGEHRRLVRDKTRAERRVDTLIDLLMAERAESRRAERWWSNMLLRAKQSYPLPPKVDQPPDTPPLVPADNTLVPGMDDGEVEALVATGAEYGVDRNEVLRTLKRERGLE